MIYRFLRFEEKINILKKSADVSVLVTSRDDSIKIFNQNELKNILTKYLALSRLTIKITIIQEYLIQNVLNRKKHETIRLSAKGCKSLTVFFFWMEEP